MVELLRGHLQGAREAGMSERCRQQLTSASVRLGCISAECTKIQATIAGSDGKAMQQLKAMPVETLELHPASLRPDPQEELLLASLHRVGDHTLDREEDA